LKLHFGPNQQYQINVIKSIIDIFEDQPLNCGVFSFYDSRRVSGLRGFTLNNNIQIPAINIDSFTKDENLLGAIRGPLP